MKKVVIAGSSSLQKEMFKWIEYFNLNGYEVLDYPRYIEEKTFIEEYPEIHKNFFNNITKCDILFIMNEDKNDIVGYIGAETYAELAFGVAQNLIYNKDIKIIINKMPGENVQSYEEIKLWLKLEWIEISNFTK